MSGPVSVSSRSATASTTNNTEQARNQALVAAIASQKPRAPSPKTLTRNGFVSNGALAAASRAGANRRTTGKQASVTDSRVDAAGAAIRATPPRYSRQSSVSPHHSLPLFPVSTGGRSSRALAQEAARQSSPSHIAAVRAAARVSTPVSNKSPMKTAWVRDSEAQNSKNESPTQTTNSLVRMYEARSGGGSEVDVKPTTVTDTPILLSPKPVRAISVRLTARRDLDETIGSPAISIASDPRQSVPTVEGGPSVPSRSSSTRAVSVEVVGQLPAQRPRPIPKGTSRTDTLQAASPTVSLGTSPRSAITTPSIGQDERVRNNQAARRSAHQFDEVRPHLNVDSLANAIVASSLASSRAPSPYKGETVSSSAPLIPPPRRSGKGLSVPPIFKQNSGMNPNQRQPSPAKTTLKTTLRSNPTNDDVVTVPKPGKLRKNGRTELDSISATDRRLYEGVWAANRGTLIPEDSVGNGSMSSLIPSQRTSTAASSLLFQRSKIAEDVHGYVVRDIWSRSGLANAALEQVWALVDGGENGVKRSAPGCLNRQEFVVGMWLIDQALMGRKIPPRKLPDEVWASLRVGSGFEFRR